MTQRRDPAREPTDEELKAFYDAIESVCQEHQLWIAHEDSHGAFIIVADESEAEFG